MRDIKKPALRLSPVTRDDGPYENVFLNIGTNGDRSSYTRALNRRLMTEQELQLLYSTDGFASRIIDLPAEEITRAGFEVEGVDAEHKVQAILETIKTDQSITNAYRWAMLFGGALVVMLVDDGGDFETPLVPEKARGIEQLRVYDRYRISRDKRYDDPNDKRFGATEIYQINPVQGSPYKVHESRCLIFDGLPVPDLEREQNDGWGGSRLQKCFDQLTRFNLSQYWANALLERAQQAVHGIPDLTNLLRSPGGEALVKKRVDIVDMTRSINNTVVIDALETYELKSTPLSGVSDILDRLGLALSAVTGMPESLLFGRQQGGLNSTGKSDLENWYAKVGQTQNSDILPQLDKLVTVALHVAGKFKEEYLIKFKPLSVPSDKDKSESDYKKAQTREIYYNIQALDPTEIRTMLDEEGFPIEDVMKVPENAPEEPAPTEKTPVPKP